MATTETTERTKHTPGPWRIFKHGHHDDMLVRQNATGRAWLHNSRTIAGDGNRIIADVSYNEPLGGSSVGGWPDAASKDEMLANANLIAAAPELLEALRLCSYVLHDMPNAADDPLYDPTMAEACRLARAAIAKAEGGEA